MNPAINPIISVTGIGVFTYDQESHSYTHQEGSINWRLKLENKNAKTADVDQLVSRAESLVSEFGEFEQAAGRAVAEKLIDFKNDFWPEYNEDDPDLD
ncbi:hypothetical protein [Saccharibacillus kuerlensis]|uniref:Uncharacterized protein n=1 Tax=Saccharibacillus kuerlensis TaxID=459527 RepID=A0ABQ2LAG1_9BACL|nr:hypothetical protein [Saccharibacillus kuerlensis]GGO08404.1 hypothetical protein GCM10010969_37850 [Saccharibacillus kuerlensis]